MIQKKAISVLLCFKSNTLVFRQHVCSHANQAHCHMKGFAGGLVLKPKHEVTRKCHDSNWFNIGHEKDHAFGGHAIS